MVGRLDFQDVALKDRLRASELLGRSQGDFVEKHAVTVSGSLDPASMTEDELDAWIVAKAQEITIKRAVSASTPENGQRRPDP